MFPPLTTVALRRRCCRGRRAPRARPRAAGCVSVVRKSSSNPGSSCTRLAAGRSSAKASGGGVDEVLHPFALDRGQAWTGRLHCRALCREQGLDEDVAGGGLDVVVDPDVRAVAVRGELGRPSGVTISRRRLTWSANRAMPGYLGVEGAQRPLRHGEFGPGRPCAGTPTPWAAQGWVPSHRRDRASALPWSSGRGLTIGVRGAGRSAAAAGRGHRRRRGSTPARPRPEVRPIGWAQASPLAKAPSTSKPYRSSRNYVGGSVHSRGDGS